MELGSGDKTDVLDVSDSDYDTDVDDESRRGTPFDPCGKRTYVRTCRKLSVAPRSSILKALGGAAIDIRGHALGEKDLLALSNALLDNTTVTQLSLIENPLTDKSCQFLFLALTENLNITKLVLRNICSSEGTCVDTCVQLLSETLSDNGTIQQVDMAENGLKDIHAIHFVSILQNCKTLIHLNLSHNNFGDSGGQELATGLAVNDTLRCLDVSWNKLQVAGTTAVLQAIEGHAALKTLVLAMSGLSTTGAIAVARLLARNIILTELDISFCRIRDTGAMVIARALAVNTSLTTLTMTNNPMSSTGALELLSAIEGNTDSLLELLDILSVVVNDDVFAVLNKLKAKRRPFRLVCSGPSSGRTAAR